MSYQLFQKLKERLIEKQDDICRSLGQGHASNYEEYRSLVGEIKGLATAHSLVIETLKTFDEDE